jgi:putative spermidine/putrescine transport system permease protein
MIRAGAVSGSIVAFLLSLINLPVSLFLSSGAERTLPMEMFNYMTSRIDPLMASLSVTMMVMSAVLGFVMVKVLKVKLF